MAFTACKKDDSPTTTSNTLKVSGTTYTYGTTGTSFTVAGSSVLVTAANGSNATGVVMAFSGGTTSPVAGTYRVISRDSTLKAGQMFFVATSNTTGSTEYHSTGAGNVDATVSITNGKYTIVMPDAEAKPASGSAASTTLAVTLTQQ